jgi:deazaflavin-dependent oxidoreductase (nitroreductase family)
MMFRQHRRKGTFMGMDILFLNTVGKRTGQRRETAVSWFPDGDDAWLIVASAGGAAHNPAWYHNLAAHPDQVSIELPGRRTVKVTPEQLDGERREAAWKRITEVQPRYAKYQEKTDRKLPVIRLTADKAATAPDDEVADDA